MNNKTNKKTNKKTGEKIPYIYYAYPKFMLGIKVNIPTKNRKTGKITYEEDIIDCQDVLVFTRILEYKEMYLKICIVSDDKLATDLFASVISISRSIRKLEIAGFLTRDSGKFHRIITPLDKHIKLSKAHKNDITEDEKYHTKDATPEPEKPAKEKRVLGNLQKITTTVDNDPKPVKQPLKCFPTDSTEKEILEWRAENKKIHEKNRTELQAWKERYPDAN